MNNFDIAMIFVLKWERSYPNADIKKCTKKQAKNIYRKDYWDKIKGDKLPKKTAITVMDYAVNLGVDRATKTLQKVVNVSQDGIIGPKTLENVSKMFDADIAYLIIKERVKFICNLVRNHPSYSVFLADWMYRTHDLMAFTVRNEMR